MSLAEKKAKLDKIAAGFNKKTGKALMGRISEVVELQQKLKTEFIPTPTMNVNAALGGGFAKGRTTIVAGMPDSGKTGLLLETIGRNMQDNPDFIAGWLESEHSLSEDHIKMFGIDPDRFFYLEHDRDGAGEQALDLVESTLASNTVDMMVINSLKCLVPSEEFRKSMGEVQVGAQARMNAKMTRKLTSIVAENNVAFVIVQHLTTQIGKMGPDPMIVAGGNSIIYGAAVVMDLRKRSVLDTDPISKEEGIKIGVIMKKNHVMIDKFPYVKTEYFAIFGQGIEQYLELLDNAVNQGFLAKNGAFISVKDDSGEIKVVDGVKMQWQGAAKFREYCIANQPFFKDLKNKVNGIVEMLDVQEVAEIEAEQKVVESTLDEDVVKASRKKK